MRSRLLIGCSLVALAGSAFAGQANWESELREMGYLFLHISNVNVINGLNLTREQAAKLQKLAVEMEAAASQPPTLRAPLSPELDAVRKSWLELRDLLLECKPIPPELEQRVSNGRAAESKAIRSMILAKPAATSTQCSSCHCAPNAGTAQPMTVGPGLQGLVGLAHAEALYGKRGLAKLVQLSSQVEATLTDAQKAILGKFSCCLVPPQDLSDPVRAGQAEVSDKALELLRKCRGCPEGFWPLMRGNILSYTEHITDAISPGSTAARKAAAREAVAKTIDRARACSDVEFEMEKEQLARSVRAGIVPAPGEGPHKAAYFLLMPGSSKVYAACLRRLNRPQRFGSLGDVGANLVFALITGEGAR